MNEPSCRKERASESFGDKVLEAVGTGLGVGLFLLMLWLFGDLFWDPPLSIIDWFF